VDEVDKPTDVFSALLTAIDVRRRELPVPGEGSSEPEDQRTRLAGLRLEADRLETQLHSRITHQPVTYGEAAFCAECGEPAPCPTIRGLSAEYDVEP
jgi:hypothetical protein